MSLFTKFRDGALRVADPVGLLPGNDGLTGIRSVGNFADDPVGFITGSQAARRRFGNATSGANQRLQDALAQGRELLNPLVQLGDQALAQLTTDLASGGTLAQPFNSAFNPDAFAFQAGALPPSANARITNRAVDPRLDGLNNRFTPATPTFSSQAFARQGGLQADPGFQFRLAQGRQALEASAAARGKALSGQAAQALSRFNQQLAAQEFAAARDRAFAENRQAFAREQTLDDTRFNRGLTLNRTAFDRARQQEAVRQALAAANFDRSLALNNTRRQRRLQENQLRFGRARNQDQRQERRFDQNQRQRFERLARLVGLSTGPRSNLAGLAARAAGVQGQNLLDAGALGADLAGSDRKFLQDNLPALLSLLGGGGAPGGLGGGAAGGLGGGGVG